MVTVEDICAECNNFFVRDKIFGVFKISDGIISPLNLEEGQYFRIINSVSNDGVYKNAPEDLEKLENEIFDGAIWVMAVPKKVLELAKEINDWQERYGEVIANPYTSESFGGYSYSKSSNINAGNSSLNWQTMFKPKLDRWRKLRI